MEHSLERRKRKCRRHFPRRSWRSKQLPLNKCFLNFYISKAVKITQKHAFLGWNTFIPNFRKYCFVHDLYPGIFWMELYGNILKYTNIVWGENVWHIERVRPRPNLASTAGAMQQDTYKWLIPPPPSSWTVSLARDQGVFNFECIFLHTNRTMRKRLRSKDHLVCTLVLRRTEIFKENDLSNTVYSGRSLNRAVMAWPNQEVFLHCDQQSMLRLYAHLWYIIS